MVTLSASDNLYSWILTKYSPDVRQITEADLTTGPARKLLDHLIFEQEIPVIEAKQTTMNQHLIYVGEEKDIEEITNHIFESIEVNLSQLSEKPSLIEEITQKVVSGMGACYNLPSITYDEIQMILPLGEIFSQVYEKITHSLLRSAGGNISIPIESYLKLTNEK